MRQGWRTKSPSLLTGGEQAEQPTGLDWGCSLVGERLLAAAQLATAIHMALDTDARRTPDPQCDDSTRRAQL